MKFSDPNQINLDDIVGMVQHWCSTPSGTYLGSPYGHKFKKDLHRPLEEVDAQARLSELVQDIPLVANIGNVMLSSKPDGNDRLIYTITIVGASFARSFDIGGF